jgi:hypothetical protein
MGDEQVAKKGIRYIRVRLPSHHGQASSTTTLLSFWQGCALRNECIADSNRKCSRINAHVFLETLELKASNHVGQSAICCPISKTLIPYRLSRWRCCSLLVEGLSLWLTPTLSRKQSRHFEPGNDITFYWHEYR